MVGAPARRRQAVAERHYNLVTSRMRIRATKSKTAHHTAKCNALFLLWIFGGRRSIEVLQKSYRTYCVLKRHLDQMPPKLPPPIAADFATAVTNLQQCIPRNRPFPVHRRRCPQSSWSLLGTSPNTLLGSKAVTSRSVCWVTQSKTSWPTFPPNAWSSGC